MEDFKTWEEMTVLEQYACTYWDMYKDAYGVRPRGIDTSSWSESDFEREFFQLSVTIAEEDRIRKEAQEKAAHDFEMRILSLQMTGATDRDMALRWVHEAEGSDGDDEYLCFLVGLPYGYFRRETV